MKSFYLFLISLFTLLACASSVSNEELLAQIADLESKNGQTPNVENSKTLMTLYETYVKNNPGQTDINAGYLFRSAEVARSIRSFEKAIMLYDDIITNYPTTEKSAQALFLKAFTLDNELKKFDEAKIIYESFLQKYPNDEFADDTQFLLNNLGKSEEEIIKSFEKNLGQ
jgi:tetratricopeptide (TPR) repeat protein